MSTKSNVFIEVTLTDNCNCQCAYCFEGAKQHKERDLRIEAKQLELIEDACRTFDTSKNGNLTISFWGGEPFMNLDFMLQIMRETCGWSYVRYHCYTNGTLCYKFKELLESDIFPKVKDKLHIQLSYDGEPHHTLKRGSNGPLVLETARMLAGAGVKFSFKSTLSYDMLEHLPVIWDSYKQLFDEFGGFVDYCPTLDTATSPTEEHLAVWKKVVLEVAKREVLFILQHGRSLWSWFSNGRKMNCALENSVHMHNDGSIYVCHGCPYLSNSNRFKRGDIFSISGLNEVINGEFQLDLDGPCLLCEATQCSACHVSQLKPEDDVHADWSRCRASDVMRCKLYKHFGYVSKLLHFTLAKAYGVFTLK